ncbi:MAG: hypothetical protein K0Q55_3232 [Verrucomicrobia bacterium]|nr:hypothetical protein [Verrucomicrobiota bacterium]
MTTLRVIFILLTTILVVTPCRAVVLDWSTVSWTAGSLSNTYDVDGDSKDDVTITISGDTSALVSGYPTISTTMQGGLGSADDGLELRLNFTTDSQSITVTVTFLNDYVGASDVSFSLFDIDGNRVGASPNYRYRDYLENIVASGDSGLIAAALTDSTANAVAGSGTNQTVTGNAAAADFGTGSGDGNVGVDYGTNNVNSVSFTFGNTGNILGDNPQEQVFAMHDVKFKSKIPEVGTTLMAVALCAGVIGTRLIRFRRQPKA